MLAAARGKAMMLVVALLDASRVCAAKGVADAGDVAYEAGFFSG